MFKPPVTQTPTCRGPHLSRPSLQGLPSPLTNRVNPGLVLSLDPASVDNRVTSNHGDALMLLPHVLMEPQTQVLDSLHIVIALPRRESEPGVDVAFLGTRAGLLRRSLYVGSEKVSDR